MLRRWCRRSQRGRRLLPARCQSPRWDQPWSGWSSWCRPTRSAAVTLLEPTISPTAVQAVADAHERLIMVPGMVPWSVQCVPSQRSANETVRALMCLPIARQDTGAGEQGTAARASVWVLGNVLHGPVRAIPPFRRRSAHVQPTPLPVGRARGGGRTRDGSEPRRRGPVRDDLWGDGTPRSVDEHRILGPRRSFIRRFSGWSGAPDRRPSQVALPEFEWLVNCQRRQHPYQLVRWQYGVEWEQRDWGERDRGFGAAESFARGRSVPAGDVRYALV